MERFSRCHAEEPPQQPTASNAASAVHVASAVDAENQTLVSELTLPSSASLFQGPLYPNFGAQPSDQTGLGGESRLEATGEGIEPQRRRDHDDCSTDSQESLLRVLLETLHQRPPSVASKSHLDEKPILEAPSKIVDPKLNTASEAAANPEDEKPVSDYVLDSTDPDDDDDLMVIVRERASGQHKEASYSVPTPPPAAPTPPTLEDGACFWTSDGDDDDLMIIVSKRANGQHKAASDSIPTDQPAAPVTPTRSFSFLSPHRCIRRTPNQTSKHLTVTTFLQGWPFL